MERTMEGSGPNPLGMALVTPTELIRVQEKVAPLEVVLKATDDVATPEQTVWLDGVFEMEGMGLTVITARESGPVQPLMVALAVMVTLAGRGFGLIRVKAGSVLLLPDAGFIPLIPGCPVAVQE